MKSSKKHIYEFYPYTMPTEIEVSKHMFYYYCNKYCNDGYEWRKQMTEYSDKVVYRLTFWKKTYNNEQNN